MGVDTKKEILDGLKGIVWVALLIAGFLAVDKLSSIDRKLEKLEDIETRLIRVEYELKLK